MPSSVISLGLAVVIGVVIGLLLQSPDAPPPRATTDTPVMRNNPPLPTSEITDTGLDGLRRQLLQEIDARKTLQAKVDTLERKLAGLETARHKATDDGRPASPHRPNPAATRAWFNPQALIDAGVDSTTAQQLKARYEKQELDRLYLRDRAVREGWYGSQRYREELEKLDAQLGDLQEELGDETYAAYLYATGQSNRVTVQSVLAGSAADRAGLRTDDHILRYGGKRIYNWRDLREATTEGDINETVPLEIVRDGKPQTLYVQRGPLGIRMSSVSVAP